MKRFIAVILSAALAAMILAIIPTQKADLQAKEGKLLKSERAIPGRYIVVFEDNGAGLRGSDSMAEEVASELSAIHGGSVERIFKHALNGFSIEMSEKQAEAMSRDPRVSFIEEDAEVSINATQTNATFGLDRIDQRDLPLNQTYIYNADGTGVTA